MPRRSGFLPAQHPLHLFLLARVAAREERSAADVHAWGWSPMGKRVRLPDRPGMLARGQAELMPKTFVRNSVTVTPHSILLRDYEQGVGSG